MNRMTRIPERSASLFCLVFLAVLGAAGCAAQTPPDAGSGAANSGIAADTMKADNALKALSIPQGAEPTIRVLLVEAAPEIVLTPKSTWIARPLDAADTGELAAPPESETKIVLREGRVRIENGEGSLEGAAARIDAVDAGGAVAVRAAGSPGDRVHEGRLEVHPTKDGKLQLIVALPLEEYLRGVVPFEIGADSPIEAMCAQAVAARSEACVALVTRKYAGDRYDICSDVTCQVYGGAGRRNARTDESVRRTRGQVLLFEEQPISAYYAASCGGHSEDIRNVWGNRAKESAYWDAARFDGEGNAALDLTREADLRAWLSSSPVVHCNPKHFTLPTFTHRNFRWTREADAAALSALVAQKKDIGRIVALRPLKRGVSGRILQLEYVGEKGTLVLNNELEIRRVFNPRMPSSAFVIDAQGPKERPDKFLFTGAGSGHGVGMCQTGAIGMANAGRPFAEILKHYYPKTTLTKLY